MKQYTSHTPKSLGTLIAACAVLAACGGGNSSDSAKEGTSSVQPTSEAASAAAAAASDSAASAPDAGASAASGTSAAALSGGPDATSSRGSTTKGSGTSPTTTATGTAGGSVSTATGSGSVVIGTGIPGAAPTTKSATTTADPTTSTAGATARALTATATDVRIYVDVAGNDGADGAAAAVTGSSGPVKTLARAQQLARAKIASMTAGSVARLPVRVLIGPGEYALSSTLGFTPLDSGTVDAPVSYEATVPRSTVITGAVSLGSRTAPSTATSVAFPAASYASLTKGGGQLFVNDRRATLARQPNGSATWFVKAPAPLSTEAAGQTGREAFVMRTANYPWFTALSSTDKQRAIVNVMQAWSAGRHRIASNGAPAGAMGISPRAPYPFLYFGNSQRYFIENTKSALDAAGEWIYDDGEVLYIRQADEANKTIKASLPVLETLVTVAGDGSRNVENLKFVGLDFSHTRYLTPDAGFHDLQASVAIGAAVEINRGTRVTVENCNFSKTGGWGLWLKHAVRESRVVNNTFVDMGAGAVKVGVTSEVPYDPLGTSNNTVNANKISETGKVFPGATAIWIGNTWDNVVSRNTIFNTTYSAISVGWSWGYKEPTSGRNKISHNLLYNIGQRLMGDLAAVYTLGTSPGTTITNNIIREVRGYTYGPGAWGIYGDEGTSGILVENNIVYGTDSGAYHLNFGRDNVVRGNIFAGGEKAEVRLSKSETATNLVMQNNLLLPRTTNPFDMYAQAPSVLYSANELSNKLIGQPVATAKCGTGCVLGSSTVTATSSPLALGSPVASWDAKIQSIVAAHAGSGPVAGTYGTSTALPAAVNPPLPILAPAQDFVFNPAAHALGSQPAGLTYIPANNPDAIKVVSNAAVSGGKCLAFNDSSAFTNTWDPHAYAKLEHLNGYSVVEFSLLIDAATILNHEWRDNDSTFKSGPSMNITKAGVEVGGSIVAPITVGQWTKFKISTPIGAAGTYKWKLEVTASNGAQTVVENLAHKTSSWGRLNWLGFVSNARVLSSPCLADLKVTNLEP